MISKTTTLFAAIVLLLPLTPFASAPEPDTSLVAPGENVPAYLLRELSKLTPKTSEVSENKIPRTRSLTKNNSPLQRQKVASHSHFAGAIHLHLAGGPIAKIKAGWTNDCAQHAVAILLRTSGYKIDKAVYAEIGRAINPQQKGSHIENLEPFLNKYYRCVTLRNADHKVLVNHLHKGLPALAIVQTVPNACHCAIVVGCTHRADGSIDKWILRDNGVLKDVLPHPEFIQLWECRDIGQEMKNVCLLIYPKKGKTPKSKPPLISSHGTEATPS